MIILKRYGYVVDIFCLFNSHRGTTSAVDWNPQLIETEWPIYASVNYATVETDYGLLSIVSLETNFSEIGVNIVFNKNE